MSFLETTAGKLVAATVVIIVLVVIYMMYMGEGYTVWEGLTNVPGDVSNRLYGVIPTTISNIHVPRSRAF